MGCWLILCGEDDGWENKKDNFEEGVQDFPENAAHWTGEKVCHMPHHPICFL